MQRMKRMHRTTRMKRVFCALTVFLALALGAGAQGRPVWLDFPLRYGLEKYEPNRAAVPTWYYTVGISRSMATDERARRQALISVRTDFAGIVHSGFATRLELSEIAALRELDIDFEDLWELLWLPVLVTTTIPDVEALEWYIETGRENGKPWYRAYVFGRILRRDLIAIVSRIDPEEFVYHLEGQVSNYIDRKANDGEIRDDAFTEAEYFALVQQVTEIRKYVLEGITKAVTGN